MNVEWVPISRTDGESSHQQQHKRQGSVVQINLAFDFEGQLEKNSVAQVNGVVEDTKDNIETEGRVDTATMVWATTAPTSQWKRVDESALLHRLHVL